MAIDLKNLIDQVLGMAKESLDLRKRNAGDSWYGGNKDEEDYWKEIRRRNTELALRDTEGKNRLAERELINSGEIARQQLMNEATRYTADRGLEGHKYTADRGFEGHRYTADTNYAAKLAELNKGYDPELIKAHQAIISNVNSTPEAVKASQEAIDWYTKRAMANRGAAFIKEEPQVGTPPPKGNLGTSSTDVGGFVGKFLGENAVPAPTMEDVSAFRSKNPAPAPAPAPAKPISPNPSSNIPPTGLGGSLGRIIYGATHPFETAEQGVPLTRATSPLRESLDKSIFNDIPSYVSQTANKVAQNAIEFGQNVPRGYLAEQEAVADRKSVV